MYSMGGSLPREKKEEVNDGQSKQRNSPLLAEAWREKSRKPLVGIWGEVNQISPF